MRNKNIIPQFSIKKYFKQYSQNQSLCISEPLSTLSTIIHNLNDLFASSVHLNVIKFIRENATCNECTILAQKLPIKFNQSFIFYLSHVTLKWLLILLFSELQWVLSD